MTGPVPTAPGAAPERLYSVPHVAVFLVAWAATQLAIAFVQFPEALVGAQIDGDGYFRLVRVQHLLATGAWWDTTIPGSNWPFGEVIHWTRPLDLLMVALAAPFMLGMPPEAAVALSGAIISALAHGALCVAGVWVIAPLVPGPSRFLVMPALLAHPGVLTYGTLGRADHHVLVLLLAFLAMGAWIRALLDPQRGRMAVLTGGLMALALWVSPEALVPMAAMFGGGGLAWILAGPRYQSANLWLALGLAAGLALAIPLERPPGDWTTVAFDRLSIAHLTMALIAGAFWWAAGRLAAWRRLDLPARAGFAVVGGLTSLGLLRVIHPGFFQGPAAHADPRMEQIFFPFVDELQPLLPVDLVTTGEALSFLGLVFLALPYAAFRVARARSAGPRAAWGFMLVSVLLLVPLAAGQRRLVGYAGVVLCLLATALLAEVIRWAGSLQSPLVQRGTRVGAMLGIILGFLVVGSGIAQLSGPDELPGADLDAVGMEQGCHVGALARVLSDPEGLGDRPRTVVASPNLGPEILYRTDHRILSGPYHRNVQGMGAIVDLLTSQDAQLVHRLVEEREVEIVVLCPALDEAYFTLAGGLGDDAGSVDALPLYRSLTQAQPPDWMDPVPLAGESVSGFRVFVRR